MPRPIAAFVLVLLTGCTVTPSEVAPDAAVTVGGVVARQDGSAAGGVPVSLVRHEGVAETFGAILTLGAACIGEDKALSVCKSARRDTTGGDGHFAFSLKGSDTQGLLGDASSLEVAAELPRATREAAGPSAAMQFLVQTERLSLPLRMWEPDLEAVAETRNGAVTWTPVDQAILPDGIDAEAATERILFRRGPVRSGDLTTLREVSLWEPVGAATNPVSILAEVGSGLAPPVDRIVGGAGRGGPVAAAALLLALVGGALGSTALQRRRPTASR